MMTDAPVESLDVWGMRGKRVLLSGGGGGIGAAIASRLHGVGAQVWSLDLPGKSAPSGIHSIPCDLRDAEAIARCVKAFASQESEMLDSLIHCAGVTEDAVLWKMGDEAWRRVMAVNLDAAFYLLRACAPLLRNNGSGSVVLISSINGERGKFGQSNYSASKAGLLGFAKASARELGRFDVRVNCVCPGFIETPMSEAMPVAGKQRAVAESVLGRAGRPEDVAHAALFLCSPLSAHITGQSLRVDGGQLMA